MAHESELLDPYATLHVASDAELEDIRAAYKRACMLYHPDKHPIHKKAAAERLFSKIQTSYAVLSDPVQRDIYNRLGWKGIEAAWQLGPHISNIDAVKKVLEDEKRRLFSRPAHCKITIQTHVDATGLENFLLHEVEDGNILLDFLPGVKGLSIGQRFEQIFDNGMVGTLSLDVLSQAGIGFGSLSANLSKALGPFSKLSVGIGLGTHKRVAASYSKQLLRNTSVNFAFTGGIFGGRISPSFQLALNRVVHERFLVTAAVVTERPNAMSKYSSGIVLAGSFVDEKRPCTISCHLNNDGRIKLDMKHSSPIFGDEQLTFKIKLSTTRSMFSFGVFKQFSEGIKGGASIDLSADLGTVLKLSFTRYEYHFVIPIIISSELTNFSLLLATAIPTLAISLVRSGWKMLEKRRNRRYWEDYKESRKGAIAHRREEAVIAQWLMEDQFSALFNASHLRIIKAIYRECGHKETDFDIRIPLQLLVSEDSLFLLPNSLSSLLGCYDLAIGCEKELDIEYEFRGDLHSAILKDSETIVLPQRTHRKQL